jgi:signal transduction histidine kinase/ActR/RegA family two-component response regulator
MSSRKPGSTKRLRVVRSGETATVAPPEPPSNARAERTLAAMAARITEARTLAESDRMQLAALQGLVEARTCFISRFDPMRGRLLVTCTRGRNDNRVAACEPGEGPVGQAFQDQDIVHEGGIAVAPLVGSEGALGCLVILDAKRLLSDELLRALSAQIVAAAEVARLRDEAVRRTKDLETAVAGLKGLERNREELLAHVSHDLKNPLTTIKTYLTMLERGTLGALEDRTQRAVEICQRNADRLLRQINDLLLVSRLDEGEMALDERPFGLKSLAQDVLEAVRPTAERAQVALKLRPSVEAFVRGNRTRLTEALLKVLENAIHNSPPHRAVDCTVQVDRSGVARVSVRDHGEGATQAELDHAFDGFYRPGSAQRARRTGAELALPIAAKIVRLHGGQISATAHPGEGSTVVVVLPTFAAVAAAPRAPLGRDGAILLVEDDRDCRDVLRQVLEEENYQVVPVATCRDALSALEQAKPALVLLDLRLSDGDGRAVLKHIRDTPALSEVPVYVISGASDAAQLTSEPGLHVEGLLEKPLQLPKLLDAVASAVRPSETSATPRTDR